MNHDIEADLCPCCGRNCPRENLHCPRGKEYFGIETDTMSEERGGHHHGHADADMTIDDKVIALLRKCGHYLHHNKGKDNFDSEQSLSFLSNDEKHELITLLKKCLQHW